MLDSVLDFTVVVVPTLLGIAGFIVSLKIPADKHIGKLRVGLLIVGVVLSGLTWWQQTRARVSHEAEVRVLNNNVEYMKGRLDTIGAMLIKIGERTNDPGVEQVLAAIASIKPTDQLRQDASRLADRFTNIGQEYVKDFDRINGERRSAIDRNDVPLAKKLEAEGLERHDQVEKDYRQVLQQARDLRVQILGNFPIQDPPTPPEETAGYQGLPRMKEWATYLENLAKKLPEK